MLAELLSRHDGVDLDVLVWRFPQALLAASTAPCGGGLGPRRWALNAQVSDDYSRKDVETHIRELADTFHLAGEGVGMLTAAHVRRREVASDRGLDAEVTVGLSHPTWAASDEPEIASIVGTINIAVFVPVRLTDAALVNAIATATEAKSQALFDVGIPATGTPSDAVSIFCPLEGDAENFAGPRSVWGASLARAVHRATVVGATLWPT